MFAPVRELCGQCQKVVYPTEKMVLEGSVIHKACFTCLHCKRKLTIGNFAAVNGQIYCKAHYLELFKAHGGRYDKAFGAFGSGRGAALTGTEDARSEQPSELSMIKDELSTISINQSTLSEAPSDVNESVMTEASAASLVKARKEALERKGSASSSSAPPPAKLEPQTSEGKAKLLASKFERGQSASGISTSEQEPPAKKAPLTSTGGSVRALAGALDKSQIVSKLGQTYVPPAKASTDTESSFVAQAPSSPVTARAPAEETEVEPGGLAHAQMARPMISAQRRKPTIEKALFTAPLVSPETASPAPEEPAVSAGTIEEVEKLPVNAKEVPQEQEEDFSGVDVSYAFLPAQKAVDLRQVLSTATGLFLELELKKKALKALVKQKQETISRLKESGVAASGETVSVKAPSTTNPNEGGEEEEEEEAPSAVLIEDEDAFNAYSKERDGDLNGARECHQRASARALASPPLTEAGARAVAAYASFAVRHDLEQLMEDDDYAQAVSDAFDAIQQTAARDSVEPERAVFLHKVLGFVDEALDAYRYAYERNPDDAELVCNYASFLHKRLAPDLENEEGDAAGALEVRLTAADLFRHALELIPEEDVVRCNLAALLVNLSRADSVASKELLEEARDVLAKADQSNPIVLYNSACVVSLLGQDLDECRSFLERTFAARPSMRGDASEDPDLANARSCSWFSGL